MNIAYFHPQIVHFVIALLFVGVIARLLSLLPLPSALRFFGPAGATLIILGALATIPAVKSGEDAHGPAERVPGARQAVVEHEEYGERARNVFLVIAALEVAGLALLARRPRVARGVMALSSAVSLAGLFMLYEAAEHGGELVYNYAGNIGLRSGDTTDLRNALVAALYHNAMQQREAGNREEAARLIDQMVRLRPGDLEMQLLGAESVARDQNNPRGAIAILEVMVVPDTAVRLSRRRDRIMTDARRMLDSGATRSDTAPAAPGRDGARGPQ